jgi:hypothetical protein
MQAGEKPAHAGTVRERQRTHARQSGKSKALKSHVSALLNLPTFPEV